MTPSFFSPSRKTIRTHMTQNGMSSTSKQTPASGSTSTTIIRVLMYAKLHLFETQDADTTHSPCIFMVTISTFYTRAQATGTASRSTTQRISSAGTLRIYHLLGTSLFNSMPTTQALGHFTVILAGICRRASS
jgi:hypothetical protein